MVLYEIASRYRKLADLLDGSDEEFEQTLRDTMEGVEEELEEAADWFAKIIRQAESESDVISREQKRLAAKQLALKNKAARIRTKLRAAMEVTGKTKFRTALFSYSVANNPPSVEVSDVGALPEDYVCVYTKYEPDKKAIKTALLAGEEINGATLKQGRRLSIR